MTPQQQRAHDAYEYEIRIDNVIDMAVEAALTPSTCRLSELVAEDFLGDIATPNRHSSIYSLAEYLFAEGHGDDNAQEQIEEMSVERPDLMGICLQVSTPVRRWEGNSCTFSWGYARLNWVFGATYDEAWAQAVEWAKEQAKRPEVSDG